MHIYTHIAIILHTCVDTYIYIYIQCFSDEVMQKAPSMQRSNSDPSIAGRICICMCMYGCMPVCMCLCVYIYIYIERERYVCVCVYLSICLYV